MREHSALKGLAEKWAGAKAAERANAQTYLIELAEALGVERPRPAGSGYEFEFPIRVVARDGTEAQNFIDLYKEGHFLLEAKDADTGKNTDLLLRRAFGQARTYAAHVPGSVSPPYLLVLDVAKTLIIWDRWNGSFGGFTAHTRRIDLTMLHQRPEDIALLVDIWSNPSARDPRSHAQDVTKEIAEKLATLAKSLEDRGLDQERVARFLMRCVFAMFAEDVGLLPREAFRQTVQNAGLGGTPEVFAKALAGLWKAMDEGGLFGYDKFLRFNGHFFKDAEALPLTREDIGLLLEASRADWKDVEPTIFGTLLVRALDPVERHRLGAEYTPRAFIERLVRPTVEEPIRERWTAVQAELLQLRQTGKPKDHAAAETCLRDFHAWMRSLRFLDPACGSGNFLYVTMHLVKEIELEVINELADLTGAAELRLEEVGPAQFYGIEVKPWAREIAELVLWIGFHQHWKRHHGVQPPEPILQDTGTLECRDAILEWKSVSRLPSRDRADLTPRVTHAITGELVPDPLARQEYFEHVGERATTWPAADFIVGNPPYLGKSKQRDELGDGYVDALRAAYPDVPDGVDIVMYWWFKAASLVASGHTIRAGLITPTSITQKWTRPLTKLMRGRGAAPCWAVVNHPWADEASAAAVTVAMTVVSRNPQSVSLVEVNDRAEVVATQVARSLNDDLSIHADVAGAAAIPLQSNEGLAWQGMSLYGPGFILKPDEAQRLLDDATESDVIRPPLSGRDVAQRPRERFVIDFANCSQEEARRRARSFDIVRTRVKPSRDANPNKQRREQWWSFGRPYTEMRSATAGLRRFLATSYVSRHRTFTFVSQGVVCDDGLVVVGSDDAFILGVLSSRLHMDWALAAGGRLGVGNDPRYNKTLCFDAFPFPDPTPQLRDAIASTAAQIDEHHRGVLAHDDSLTLTSIYNVIEKMTSEANLTTEERRIHDSAACGRLRDLHHELDALVAKAYGWSWPEPAALTLERLVALHGQRLAEEARGVFCWLRPSYQIPRRGNAVDQEAPRFVLQIPSPGDVREVGDVVWPRDAVGQITAIRRVASETPITVDAALKRFAGAKRDIVERHLETLAILGEVQRLDDGRYAAFAMVT